MQNFGTPKEEVDNHKYIKIKSIRVIPSARPQMINGKKIERSGQLD